MIEEQDITKFEQVYDVNKVFMMACSEHEDRRKLLRQTRSTDFIHVDESIQRVLKTTIEPLTDRENSKSAQESKPTAAKPPR